jgi:hypothetical protein
MNGSVEDLLREGLNRLTEDARVPAGLAGKARAHQRRKKIAVRAVLACGTASVAAAALIAATGPGHSAPAPTAIQARTTAYVIGRVEKALAETKLVTQTKYAFSPAFPAITQWNYRGNFRMVQSGFIPAAVGLPWATGQVSFGIGTATINGKGAYVQVDYRHHEWYATAATGFVASACSDGQVRAEYGGPADWVTYIHHALSCGEFKVAGHSLVNGKETVRLAGSFMDPNYWAGLPRAEGRGPLHVNATLSVDPSTYLPVRVVWSNWSEVAVGKPLHGVVREDIRMLPPTARNVARASVTVPAGFRRVPDVRFAGPVFQFIG